MKGLEAELFDLDSPAERGNILLCHEEFLDALAKHRENRIGKRTAYLLQRMVVDESRLPFKGTQGANRGWRRSRLGGSGGSHYYAWWAPKGAPPLKGQPGFEDTPERAIFVRAIRHHDNHAELKAKSLDEYLAITVKDLRRNDYTPSPLTPGQARFANAKQRVRVLRGFPGSGKTTALLEATEQACAFSALYVTYSKELAALASAHFRRLAPAHKRFRVVTFSQLIREIARANRPEESERDRRRRFAQHVGGFSPRILGPWAADRNALYDEVHAHLIGGALPEDAGRFTQCARPRLPDRTYRERRRHFIGGAAADAAVESLTSLERREGAGFMERFFPELMMAWQAAEALRENGRDVLSRTGLDTVDCVAIDEAQDLTPIEAFVVARIAGLLRRITRNNLAFLAAGDEGQTVRPTDFEWGWFNDILYAAVSKASDYELETNLRSPRRIAELVNRVSDLYAFLAKQDRPGGLAAADVEEDAGDLLSYCVAVPGPELNELLTALVDRESMAVICLEDRIPEYVPEQIRHKVVTAFEAKGLDFKSVCVLDPGRHLQRVVADEDRMRRDTGVVPLNKRLAIDELRVAVSRASERLILLDVQPDKHVRELMAILVQSRGAEATIDPVIPEVVLRSLAEETLLPEERVRLCERDALQYLASKPELAWTRARQAISLLGSPGKPDGVADETIVHSAFMTAARVDFTLAVRGITLPAELGIPNLWSHAAASAGCAGRPRVAELIESLGVLFSDTCDDRLLAFTGVMRDLESARDQVEPWMVVELAGPARGWIADLEKAVEDPLWAVASVDALATAYAIFDVAGAAERLAKFKRAAISTLLDAGKFGAALPLIESDGADPKLMARCFEGLGRHRDAAEAFTQLGLIKDAVRNYRSIPDLDAARRLVASLDEYPAAEGLEWMAEVRDVLAKRPSNFARVATAAEKQWMQDLLEANLEGPRRTSAKKRAPSARKPGRPKKKPEG